MEGKGELAAPRREHLEILAKHGDQDAIDELANLPELPRLGAHLWGYFQDLHQTRSSNGMSVCRLTRQEIRLWQEDEGIELEAWERRVVIDIDAAWAKAITENRPK